MPGKFHHEAIYRTQELIARLGNLRIVLCGAGALGSNLADTLARQGATRLRVIDDDRVEEHNIGTQIYTQSDIGQPKADALRKHLFRATGIEAEAVRKRLAADNARTLLKEADLLIDAFDNSASRLLIQTHARAARVPALHAGLFVDYGEVIWDDAYRVPRDTIGEVCDYPLARNLVVLTTAIAAEAVLSWLARNEQKNWSITLADFAAREMES